MRSTFPITLSWSVTDIEVDQPSPPLALDDFDQDGESLVLALFTHGATDAYSSSSGTLHSGSDVDVTDNLTVNRVRILNLGVRLRINRSGSDRFDTYFEGTGDYVDASFYVQTQDRVITLTFLDAGGGFINFDVPTADQAHLNGLGEGDRFILAINIPEVVEVDIGAVDFPVTLSWAVDSIEVDQPDVDIGSVDFPITLAWSVASVEVEEYEIGATTFLITLSWSVSTVEVVAVPDVDIGSVTFPVTLSWSVASVEVEEYNVGSVTFPVTLTWSVAAIEVVAIPTETIGAVTFPLTISWTVTDIEVEEYNVGAVAFPITLSWAVSAIEAVAIPAVDIGSVDFPLTLAWSVDSIEAEAAFTLDDFDQEGTILVLALITVGSGDLYQEGVSGSASADSDLDVTDDMTIERIRNFSSNAQLRINRTGTDSFSTLFGGTGEYADATFYIQTADHVIELPLPAQLTLARATNIRIAIPTDDQAVFGGLSDGDKFILAITVPAAVEVGAVDFPVTLSWSVASIEVAAIPDVEVGAVTFPITLSWNVNSIEIVTIPTVLVGAVTFPLTLSWSVTNIVSIPRVDIGAVTFPIALAWTVANVVVVSIGDEMTTQKSISNDHEVLLNDLRYPILRRVNRQLASRYPGKVVFGDTSIDSRPRTSLWAQTDWSGGIGIDRLKGESNIDRVWWATLDIGHRGHLVLPPRADAVPTPLGASGFHAFEQLGNRLYGLFGRNVYRYDGASWGTALHTLAGVFNAIKHVELDGEDYLAIAHSEGIAYTNDGDTWFENGQEV